MKIDFYAGDLRVAFLRAGQVIASVDLQIDPDKSKLTRDEYAAMVAETAQATLAIYRLSAVTVPASASSVAPKVDIVTHELIRTNFPMFERAVSRISDRPLRTLHSVSATTNILQARRIEDRALAAALRGGRSRLATAREADAAPLFVGALGGRWIPDISETRRQGCNDTYEHRAILGFAQWLDRKLTDLAGRLARISSDEISYTIREVYADRISRWKLRLAALVRRSVFDGVTPDTKLFATSVFRMHPDYSASFTAMSRMRAGLGLGMVAPALPVDRTYQLYELWSYVGLLAAVAKRYPDSRGKIAAILRGCEAPNLLGVKLARGNNTEIQLDERHFLTYQRRISPLPSEDGAKTLLVEVIPDICLTRRSEDGVCEGIAVLDPKYRSGPSLIDGIRDMHVYRDAIVDVDGRHLVRAAAALAPRPSGLPIAEANLPRDRPGIFALRPTHDPGTFERLLNVALQALESGA